MKSIRIAFLSVVALAFLSSFLPDVAHATDIIVNNSSTSNCSDNTDPGTVHCTIQSAIDTAASNTTTSYSVLVEPGTYNESISLKGFTVHGRETARTIITGAVTIDTGTPSIYNFTFTNSSGISVTGSASATISNNIFYGLATAIQVTSTAGSFNITNNVFYSNGTAINSSVNLVINNNIFLSNTTAAISGTNITTANVTYNDFYGNPDNTTWGSGNSNMIKDPVIVNATGNDFHLTSSSPCIGQGTSGDIGAYSGTNADTIMFMISGLTGSVIGSNSVSVSWSANNDYRLGGYKVYYWLSSGVSGTGAMEGNSPISVAKTSTTETLSNLPATATPLSTEPTLTVSGIQNQTIDLTWTAIDGATGYVIYYDVYDSTNPSSFPTTSIDVGNRTTYPLTGLTNNVDYKIVLYAYSKAEYYIKVTAIDNSSTGPFEPGVSHESAFSTEQVTAQLGDTQWSPVSNMVIDYPEALVAYPNLPSTGQGCFIATAAYGSYMAPQVKALRTFRDRYLATSSFGRAFVGFYYKYSPSAAAWLNAHPGLKPAVRAGLMPFVGAALFMTQTTLVIKIAVMGMLVLLAVIAIRRKRTTASRFK